MAFPSLHYRGQQCQFFALQINQDAIEDLVFGLSDHLLAGKVGVCFPCARIQQAHEIINLGHRTHR